MSATLKEQKEAFVTGHNGTTVGEIMLVCLSSPIGVWLFQLVVSNQDLENSTHSLIALEALLILFPMMLAQTELLYPRGLVIMALEFLVALWLWFGQGLGVPTRRKTKKRQTDPPSASDTKDRLHFLTCFRSCVLYLTFIAILAVDFPVFPRRFAKTEVSGYGLMDLGAGSFIVAAGLVSARARKSDKQPSMGMIRKMIPLVFMGSIRLVTNKAVEYQEHASEYGIHWNFFFSLAAMAPLGSILSLPSKWQSYNWVLAVVIMTIYQVLLSKYGLQEYVVEAPRSCTEPNETNVLCNLFAANREGILGCLGYIVIYIISEDLARFCLWGKQSKSRGMRLAACSAGLWLLHYVLVDMLGISVSRRTTNVSYCVWTLAHSIAFLTLFCATMETVTNKAIPPVYDAINKNGLLVFVVANLLTGLVNLSVNTLEASDAKAICIIAAYLGAVGGFALLADGILMPFLGRIRSKAKRHEKKKAE